MAELSSQVRQTLLESAMTLEQLARRDHASADHHRELSDAYAEKAKAQSEAAAIMRKLSDG